MASGARLISPDTYFLESTPYITVTAPGDSTRGITATAYQYLDNSLYFQAGRGFTPNNQVTPDLAAPGVDLLIPLPEGAVWKGFGEQSFFGCCCRSSSIGAGMGDRERKYSLCIGKYGEVLSAERGSERRTDGIPQSGMGIWKTGSVSDI